MAKVAREDWKERIRDPKIECMSRDEMSTLQSERLVRQVKNVYENVEFYRKKMDVLGLEPGDIKGIEDIGETSIYNQRRFKGSLSVSDCLQCRRKRLCVFRERPERQEN